MALASRAKRKSVLAELGRHHEAAAAHARDTLDRVAAAMGDGCRWEPVEGGKYRVTPPRFWVDSVVHGATPVLPPTTKGAPTTGLQLVAWREKHKLSQVAAAGVLGVGVQTIKRAELVQWIRDSGRIPVERDTLYNVIRSAAVAS